MCCYYFLIKFFFSFLLYCLICNEAQSKVAKGKKQTKAAKDCELLLLVFLYFIFLFTSYLTFIFNFYFFSFCFVVYISKPFAVNLAVQEPNHFWFLVGSARNHITGCVVIQNMMLADHVPLCGNCILCYLVKMTHLIKRYLKQEWLELISNQEREF